MSHAFGRRLSVLAAVCAICPACAFGPGGHFAELEPTLEARFSPPAERLTPDGWLALESGFEVRVTRFDLELEPFELLTDEEEGSEALPRLSGGGPFDLLSPAAVPLSCEGSCGLPASTVTRVRTGVRRLDVEGSVRDGQTPPRLAGVRELVWRRGPPAAPVPLSGDVELTSDRYEPPFVRLQLGLSVGAELFEEVDFAAPADEQLAERLSEVPITSALDRAYTRGQP